jgi:glutathione peroxidase
VRRARIALTAAALLALAAGPAGETADVLDFTMKRLNGVEQDLGAYRGRVGLFVNVASRCGLTPQYEGLQKLWDTYRDRGLVVLGFPANDFAGQEPGTDAEIADFCRANYGVSFPMFSKIHVKGPEQHPLYVRLTAQPEPIGGPVEWNFQKYLVDRTGRVIAKFGPRTTPDDAALVAKIEELLGD